MCLSLTLIFALPSFAQDVTAEPTAEVTVTPEVTPEPTLDVTVEPTAEITMEPTGEVTAEPATPQPTEAPTAEVTAEAPPAFPIPDNAILFGLSSPRGLSYDADGNLYVAEAGSGGAITLMESEDFGTVTVGFTGQVTMLAADGTQSVAIGGLVSTNSNEGGGGVQRVYVQGDSLWLVFNGYGPGPMQPFYGDAVIEVDKATGHIKQWIDLAAAELTNDPDGNGPDSNTNDIAWGPDGTLYIVETGANTIYTWTADGGLQAWHSWPDNTVPDSIRFAADGSFYVGFLGTGIAPGAAHIEHWSADGATLIETFGNLTAVTDIAIGQDGNLYAVQLWAYGDQGPMPGSGSVVMVSADGVTTVADGLMFPFSLAQAPDGSWAVSTGTVLPAGAGAVVTIGGE
jgi:hypothetical protein